MKRGAIPTWTTLVLDALREADNFLTTADVRQRVGATNHQVWATLIHLRSRKAVDVVISGGESYWFATPATDTRSFVLAERVPESKPRRMRKRVGKAAKSM